MTACYSGASCIGATFRDRCSPALPTVLTVFLEKLLDVGELVVRDPPATSPRGLDAVSAPRRPRHLQARVLLEGVA